MHNNHINDVEHSHHHPHSHGHTHPHEHPHTHEHSHSHGHPHTQEHTHSHEHSHTHTAMHELMVLMKYMADHNVAHTQELAELAVQLEQVGKHAAYTKVMNAVSDFTKGNQQLAEALQELM